VAGILIENAVRSDFLCSSVLGIGLNVNQQNFASDAPNPVSLKQITGDDFDITHLAELLIEQIDYWYEKLKSHSLEEIDKMYFDNLYKKNEWVLFKQGDFTFEAKITGIGEYGQLILKDKREKLLSFMFKEVEFVL
jgi:BirA family biotin operon repressor/biotin-[acetyl-CoA-carboxylase] ligase